MSWPGIHLHGNERKDSEEAQHTLSLSYSIFLSVNHVCLENSEVVWLLLVSDWPLCADVTSPIWYSPRSAAVEHLNSSDVWVLLSCAQSWLHLSLHFQTYIMLFHVSNVWKPWKFHIIVVSWLRCPLGNFSDKVDSLWINRGWPSLPCLICRHYIHYIGTISCHLKSFNLNYLVTINSQIKEDQ